MAEAEQAEAILVEVAYAREDEQMIIPLEVAPGTTAREAVEQSRIRDHFPEIDAEAQDLGIFGKMAKPDTPLRDGDRVEIYRALIADPKEARKKRAAKKDAAGAARAKKGDA